MSASERCISVTSDTAALLEEVRRRNDVRLIHAKGHSAHEYPGNDIADELAWWGKECPPFCRLWPGGGVGGATLGTGAAVDVAGVARGANENAVCDGVGQLSDPLEGHVI
jgi:hypothetical protein